MALTLTRKRLTTMLAALAAVALLATLAARLLLPAPPGDTTGAPPGLASDLQGAPPGTLEPSATLPAESEGLAIADEALTLKKEYAGLPAPYRLSESEIQPGSTVARTLQNLGLTAASVARLTADAKPVFNLARIAARTPVAVAWKDAAESTPLWIQFKLSETRKLVLAFDGDSTWQAEFRDEVVETQVAAFAGVVTSNLWNSAAMAGMDPQNIQKLAEVLAWQVDFNREVQVNDRWRLAVQQYFVKGKPVGFGEILAAEYENGGNVYTAVRFAPTEGHGEYFSPDGDSLRRMFLKSPLKFGRVTSGFTTRRFHPILKINRPHNGVDYGAPTGTPIMAVGNGVVTFAANHGPSGNQVTIRHNGVYETQYKHMNGFAAGIRPGTKIEMGQIIGYVGQTGLATGPHLHFEFHVNGKYVDPQGLKFPTADPVPEALRADFLATAQTALGELPPWSQAVLSQKKSTSSGKQNE